MKLVTRSQLGWPPSAAPSQTNTKGVKVHYEGSPVSAKLLTDHNACIAEWKSIRASHLANTVENYSDVAYNYAACPHGYLLEGRGLRKRTGANGNQTLNIAHYAIVGLVGSSGLTKPTDAMLHAIRDGIDLLRANGAGSEIKGHRDGYATACPGPDLYAWVQKGAPRPAATSEEDDMPTAAEIADAVVAKLIAGGGVLENSDLDRIIDRDHVPAARPPYNNSDYFEADGKTLKNTTWQLGYALQTGVEGIRAVLATVTAQKATIDELVKAVATLAAGIGDLDPAAIVTELKQAIEAIDIHLDVPDA